jgi:hypothetical protein
MMHLRNSQNRLTHWIRVVPKTADSVKKQFAVRATVNILALVADHHRDALLLWGTPS